MGDLLQEILNAIEEALRGVQNAMQELQDAVNDIFARAADFLGIVADWIWDAIRSCFEAVVDAVNGFINAVLQFLEGQIAPIMFYYRASVWSSDIKGSMVDISANLAQDQLIGNDKWTGDGADAYRKAVEDQPRAADDIAHVGDAMHDALLACVKAAGIFYGAILVFVGTAIGAILTGTAATATVVLAPAGIALTAGGVAALIGGVLTLGGAFINFLITQAEQMSEMRSALDDFRGEGWPSATKS